MKNQIEESIKQFLNQIQFVQDVKNGDRSIYETKYFLINGKHISIGFTARNFQLAIRCSSRTSEKISFTINEFGEVVR